MGKRNSRVSGVHDRVLDTCKGAERTRDPDGTGSNRGNGGTEAWGGIKPNSTVRSVASVNARRYMSRSHPTPMKPCKIGYSSIPVVHLPGMRRGFSACFSGVIRFAFAYIQTGRCRRSRPCLKLFLLPANGGIRQFDFQFMGKYLWAPLLGGLALFVSVPVRGAVASSGTDIVYSARYYKPGREVSRYHLWRIRADGAGRVQVTADSRAADYSPVWLADGRTVLFVREEGGTNRFCTVNEDGGPVTTIAPAPGSPMYAENISPDRRSRLVVVQAGTSQLHLLDVDSKRSRTLGPGTGAVFSPDGKWLYCPEYTKGQFSQIVDVASGKRLPVREGLRAGTWLDGGLLVAESFVESPGQPKLCLLRADGTLEREVVLPFKWDDDESPFADDLFRIPGDRDSVLYGRHAGGSSQGKVHKFYRINLKTGKAGLLAEGRDVAWSPDYRRFCTGDGRDLAPLSDKREVWVSPLHIVSLEDGSRTTIVQGLVSVGDFDWRPTH